MNYFLVSLACWIILLRIAAIRQMLIISLRGNWLGYDAPMWQKLYLTIWRDFPPTMWIDPSLSAYDCTNSDFYIDFDQVIVCLSYCFGNFWHMNWLFLSSHANCLKSLIGTEDYDFWWFDQVIVCLCYCCRVHCIRTYFNHMRYIKYVSGCFVSNGTILLDYLSSNALPNLVY